MQKITCERGGSVHKDSTAQWLRAIASTREHAAAAAAFPQTLRQDARSAEAKRSPCLSSLASPYHSGFRRPRWCTAPSHSKDRGFGWPGQEILSACPWKSLQSADSTRTGTTGGTKRLQSGKSWLILCEPTEPKPQKAESGPVYERKH